MKFEDTFFSRENRYELGVETESGTHYAAFPVTNQMAEYTEEYRISDAEYENFLANPSAAIEFIESCRRREQDDRLFLQPGSDRGVPS